MIFGGLLSLYWDSGASPSPPPPAPADLPLGVENTARPNVRVRGLYAPPPPPARRRLGGLQLEQPDSVPVPLVVRMPCPAANGLVRQPGVLLRIESAVGCAPSTRAKPAQPQVILRENPHAASFSVHTRATASAPRMCLARDARGVQAARNAAVAAAVVEDVFDELRIPARGTSTNRIQRERNRRAIEIALRLLDED